jgi:integrase/recombinase XerC
VRDARDIVAGIAESAGLPGITADILRRTFTATLARGGTDLALLADLLGNTRLDTVRGYGEPTDRDRATAIHLLPVDR